MRTEKNACRGICMRFSHHKARKSCMRQWAKIRENILFEEVRRCVLCDWLTQKSGGKKWTEIPWADSAHEKGMWAYQCCCCCAEPGLEEPPASGLACQKGINDGGFPSTIPVSRLAPTDTEVPSTRRTVTHGVHDFELLLGRHAAVQSVL